MIIHSFDYELFIGPKSGTFEDCIREPVKRIMSLFQKHNVSGEFFIDFGFLVYIRKVNNTLFNEVVDHILSLVELGQSIQFHLHPNWLFGTIAGSGSVDFQVSQQNYYVDDMEYNEFIHILESCYEIYDTFFRHNCDEKNNMIAHRAGGWQSISNQRIKDIFAKFNLKVDSSVLSQETSVSNIWNFTENPENPFEKGKFLEIAPSIVQIPIYCAFLNKFHNFVEAKTFTGVGSSSKYKKFSKKTIKTTRYLTTEHIHRIFFKKMLKIIGKEALCDENEVAVCTTHPKVFTTEAEKNLEVLLENSLHTSFGAEFAKRKL